MINQIPPSKVMIVDDDSVYVNPQIDLAYNMYNIELIHYTNWEEAESELQSNFDNYAAIIVDGKGQLTKDDPVEDDRHLNKAINWLKVQKGNRKYIPIFINTGYYDDVIKYHEIDEDIIGIYKKGENQTLQLFEQVVNTIKNSKTLKYEIKYKDAFLLFDGIILPNNKKEILLNCLQKVEDGGIQRTDFNSMRELLELLYKKLRDISLMPNEFFSGNKVTMEWCYRYLCGLNVDGPNRANPTWSKVLKNSALHAPPHIQYCLSFVKESSSALSHEYPYRYTENVFNATTHAIIEILIWFKEYLKNAK